MKYLPFLFVLISLSGSSARACVYWVQDLILYVRTTDQKFEDARVCQHTKQGQMRCLQNAARQEWVDVPKKVVRLEAGRIYYNNIECGAEFRQRNPNRQPVQVSTARQ